MNTYILIDFSNLFFRMKHASMKGATLEERLGLVMHNMFNGISKVWRKFDATHCIFAMEGKSWRKTVYPEYKRNRKVRDLKKTESELELDEQFFMAANSFTEFLQKYTAISVVKADDAEADDVIATFVFDNPNDKHIIISTDSDFHQLLSDNTSIYDPMKDNYITLNGVVDEHSIPIIDKKTGKPKTIGDPEYILFKKCIRGDSSDNIKSAYPRIREKSTKNCVGIDKAFEDRNSKSFEWNTVMLHEWTDHTNTTHVVKDLYIRNKMLIDLKEIPEYVREQVREALKLETSKDPNIRDLLFRFMRFCNQWGLVRIGENYSYYIDFLCKRYE